MNRMLSVNLSKFWVVEMNEHGMAAQQLRMDSQGILLHLEMYQPFNKLY